MRQAQVKIDGISALLMHKFPITPIEALEKKTPQEQAEHAAYRTKSGELMIPSVNIQRAFVAGAAYTKGKGRATLQKPAAACVLVTPDELLFGQREYDVDSRPVQITATRGRIVRHRPRLDRWSLEFELHWDDNLISEEQMHRIVEDTGLRVGIGDFRPERKGPFGRFSLSAWQVNGKSV